jgi:hypothetical protein
MLSDHDKLLVLEPLFYSIIITPMILLLDTKNEKVKPHYLKFTVGSVVFTEFAQKLLCLNKETRRRVIQCLNNLDELTFVGFVQNLTRKNLKMWVCDNTINYFKFCVGKENSMRYKLDFKLKAVDFPMPTDDDSNHSVVQITITVKEPGVLVDDVSTQNFEYSQKDQMADFSFRKIFTEDLNVHIARMLQNTRRFFLNRVAEQKDEARNKKRKINGRFATPTVYMNF